MAFTYAEKKPAPRSGFPHRDNSSSDPGVDAPRFGTLRPAASRLGTPVDLPGSIRDKFERSFGADLSALRLYRSEAVADAGAQAVAQGNRVAFAPGVLDFTSRSGQALLGHEISHVLSQRRGEVRGSGFLHDPALEARADAEGARAAAGETVDLPAAPLSASGAAPAAGPMQAKKASEDELNRLAGAYGKQKGVRKWSPETGLAPAADSDEKIENDALSVGGGGNNRPLLEQPILLDQGDADARSVGGRPNRVAVNPGQQKILEDSPDLDSSGNSDSLSLSMRANAPDAGHPSPGKESGAVNNVSLGLNIAKTGAGAVKDGFKIAKTFQPSGGGSPDTSAPSLPTDNPLGASFGALGILSGGLGIYSGGKSIAKAAKNLDKGGSRRDVVTGVLDTASAAAGTAGSVLTTAAGLAGTIGDTPILSSLASAGSASAWAPGLGIASGALTMMSGLAQGRAAGKTRKSLKDRVTALKQKQQTSGLNRDQSRMLQIFRQGKRNAKIKQHFQYTKAASGGIRAVGSGIGLAGGPLGVIASAAGAVGGFLTDMGGRIARRFRNKKMKNKVVANELDIQNWDEEIAKVKSLPGGANLSDKEARKVILKGRGFQSGSMSDALGQISRKRAQDLIDIADQKDESTTAQDRADAEHAIEEMGLKRKKGKFDAGLLAGKLSKN